MKLRSNIVGYYIIPYENSMHNCMIAVAYKDKNGNKLSEKLSWAKYGSIGRVFLPNVNARLHFVGSTTIDKMIELINDYKLDDYIIKKYEK